jgi:hypothetical protein
MRTSFLLIPVLAGLLACPQLQAQAENPGTPEKAPAKPAETDTTSEKIIDLHLRARGGRKALEALTQVTIEGERIEGYKDYQLVITLDAPDRIRVESTRQHLGDDYVTVTGSDGSNAWKQETLPKRKNPTKVTGLDKQLLELDAMMPYLFLDHEANGHVFAYRGKDTFAKREAYVLHAWLKNGFELDVLFDAKSFHIIDYRHLFRIGSKPVIVDRAPVGLFRLGETWWEKGYVYRLRGKSFREITYESIEQAKPPAEDAFTEPPTHERWLKIKR